LRPPALAAENRRPCHLCLVRDAQCIAVTASSLSEPLAVPAAIVRAAIAIVIAVAMMAIPVSGMAIDAIAAIAAGKIQEGNL
jgi:hypothetical protein